MLMMMEALLSTMFLLGSFMPTDCRSGSFQMVLAMMPYIAPADSSRNTAALPTANKRSFDCVTSDAFKINCALTPIRMCAMPFTRLTEIT
eukprot:2580672-Pleurochrysis_carterae.AAC.1